MKFLKYKLKQVFKKVIFDVKYVKVDNSSRFIRIFLNFGPKPYKYWDVNKLKFNLST